MAFLRTRALHLIVFVTGACVLIIEVTAVRILSPYFGNTIFTFSSVITVILAALSLGYALGGRIADRRPEEALFHAIILASGLSVLLAQIIALSLLPKWGYAFSLSSGPLVWAMFLFFFPAFLLGTLSPFAIALLHRRAPNEGTATVAGSVFFSSTVGSIAGSLLAGFVLIPRFGVTAIVAGTGATLALMGCAGMIFSGMRPRDALPFLFLVIFGTGMIAREARAQSQRFLSLHDGVYERITIADSVFEGRPARLLWQDRSLSSGMFLDTGDPALPYARYAVLPQFLNGRMREALVIGAGAYSVPNLLLSAFPDLRVDTVDIEPSLFALGQRYFAVTDNPRLTNVTADGRRFLHDSEKRYDLIFADAYQSIASLPAHLATREFFSLARERLSPEGMFIANIIGDLSGETPNIALAVMRTFLTAFPESVFFAVRSPEASDMQNLIFVGFNGDHTVALDGPATSTETPFWASLPSLIGVWHGEGPAETPFWASLLSTEGLDAFSRSLRDHVISPEAFDLTLHPLLTDNFAPVEYLTAGSLKRSSARAQ